MQPQQFKELQEYGIGLTDLAKHRSGVDSQIGRDDFDVKAFRKKIERYKPRVVAFNGKAAAKIFFGRSVVEYGLQAEAIGKTAIFVLPSTSSAARRCWNEVVWIELRTFLKECR